MPLPDWMGQQPIVGNVPVASAFKIYISGGELIGACSSVTVERQVHQYVEPWGGVVHMAPQGEELYVRNVILRRPILLDSALMYTIKMEEGRGAPMEFTGYLMSHGMVTQTAEGIMSCNEMRFMVSCVTGPRLAEQQARQPFSMSCTVSGVGDWLERWR